MLCGKLSIPHNIVVDLNDVLADSRANCNFKVVGLRETARLREPTNKVKDLRFGSRRRRPGVTY